MEDLPAMLCSPTRLPVAVAFVLCFAVVPLAQSSDALPVDPSTTSVVPKAEVEDAIPSGNTDISEAKSDKLAATPAAATEGPPTDAKDWVCRKETPTGSHRSIKVCRRAADIEASRAEVEQTMNRQRHYGNPSVTPEG
ncbi:MAG: hypothetical protein WAW79_12930 [Steroidobacteraceae bacterium]